MVAGSILPVAFHQDTLYFLFGKENPLEDSAKGWSDFGGGCEEGETPLDTAIREGAEELTGFLGEPADIKRLLRTKGIGKVIHNDYHIHLVLIDFDENLPKYYNHNHAFLWKRMNTRVLNNTKFFEKIEIRWFSHRELTTKRHLFRPFYREMIDELRKRSF